MRLDDIDQRIIACLTRNARQSFASVGDQVGLSAPAVKRRVDKLVADGTIDRFSAVLGRPPTEIVEVFVELTCRGHTSPSSIRAIVEPHPEVIAAYTVTGPADALLHVRTETTESLEAVLERIRAADSVDRTTTTMVLSHLIDRPAIAGS